MADLVSVIGTVRAPSEVAVGGEVSWSIDVEKATNNALFLCRHRVNLTVLAGLSSYAGRRARVDGYYLGLTGVEMHVHTIETTLVADPPT